MTAAASRLFLLFFLLVGQPGLAKEEPRLVLWHKEAEASEFLENLCSEFGVANNVYLKAEYIPIDQMKQELLKGSFRRQMPDAALVPSDFIGVHAHLNLSEIPAVLKDPQISEKYHATATADGKLYGAPVLGGNHFMLFYNKKLVRQPAATWEELAAQKIALERQGIKAIGWNYNEMYWFSSFLGAFGGWPMDGGKITLDTQAMQDALLFYKSLTEQGLISNECGYDCCAKRFFAGEFAYALNGDWGYAEAEKALGENFGVAVLPSVKNNQMVPMFSTHALIFPKDSLHGPHGAVLEELVRFMQSAEVQRRLRKELKRVPVHQQVLEEFQREADSNQRQMLRQLDLARAMPSELGMTFAWEGIRKGFHRFMVGAADAKQAAQLMQRTAESQMRRNAE